MQQNNDHILSITPYRILPPTSGGQLGIVLPHHYIGQLCVDHVVSTTDNDDNNKYAFQLHKVFPVTPRRYLPYYKLSELMTIIRTYKIKAIYCDHPYMAPTAIALSKKFKIPWFLRSHNIESERFREFGKKWWPVMRIYEGYAMRHASGVFFITPQDIKWALKNYKLDKEKCHIIPYGTILDAPPQGHLAAKAVVAKELSIDASKPWLYFLGALDYLPNTQAVSFILDEIVPRLNKNNIDYHILIAGRNLDDGLKERIGKQKNVAYTGFIPDLDMLLKACDIMLNPVVLGGGIKTKAVEALGYNKVVISTNSGAVGIKEDICGGNLQLSPDHDWDAFTNNIIRSLDRQPAIPQSFYDTFYWGNIAQKIVKIMMR